MNARPRWPRGPWPRALLVVLATFALVLGAAAAAAAPGHPAAIRAATTAPHREYRPHRERGQL